MSDWLADGFVVLPGFLDPADIEPARGQLPAVYPELTEFADGVTPDHRRDPFAGQRDLPFASEELSLLAVHPRLVQLAETLLGGPDLRLYAGEAWAKFAGVAAYDQELHRDIHSPLVPSFDDALHQVELFVFLTEVDADCGPPAFVPRGVSADLPMQRIAVGNHERPDLYDAEVRATGPAGTVIAYSVETLHRATELTRPGSFRASLHANFRRAEHDWFSRQAWGDRSFHDEWGRLVVRASYRQLLLFGFPPAGHPYWTPQTLAEMQARYPGADFTTWARAVDAGQSAGGGRR